jgi:predicted TIM-barrel fold metal-dependent hydrolase
MKIILFFIFLILPTFANSFDEHYKFDHWGYERIMFGKTESREEAKKLLDSYKLNNLEVRDTNKPYLGPIIDGHAHPRKSTGKALDIGTEYFIEDLPMLTNKANVFMSVIMGTPNTYKSEDNWNYYYDFAAEHQNVLTNCHSNFIGMSANKKKYKNSEVNKEFKETIKRFKKGQCYGLGEAGLVHYNKKKKNPPYGGYQPQLDLDLKHPIIDKAFEFVNEHRMPINLHLEPFHEIDGIDRLTEFKNFYKKKCEKYPNAKIVIAHTGMMPTKDLEEIFDYCPNTYTDWKLAFHWSSLWGFEDLHIPNDYRFKLHEVWAKSMEKYSDRYFFGSDQKLGKSPAHDVFVEHYMKHVRLMIGSLSPEVQEKIAYKNAAKLFKINLNQPLIVGKQ